MYSLESSFSREDHYLKDVLNYKFLLHTYDKKQHWDESQYIPHQTCQVDQSQSLLSDHVD